MADRNAGGTNKNFTTDLGGTVTAADNVYVNKSNVDYDNASGNDISAVDITLLQWGPGHSGDVGGGDGSAPLKVVANQTNTGLVQVGWSGKTFYLQSSSGSGVIYKIQINPAKGGKVFLGPCDNEYLIVQGGIVQASAQADVERLICSGFGRAIMTLSGPELTECIAAGSSIIDLYRDAATIESIESGRINVLDDAVTPGTLNLKGGRIIGGHGNVGTANLYCGVWDLTGLTKPITVTTRNTYGPVEIWLANGGPGEPTWTTKNDYVKPTIRWF